MMIAVQGTRGFSDYNIFLRAMGTALSYMPTDDTDIKIFSVGPYQINAMASEFTNVSERGLKARGKNIKLVKVPPSWVEENIDSIDYLAFFTKPKQPLSSLVDLADAKEIEVGVYRY